ncbi:MAG: DUF305 domain-containing protein [Rhodothermales bacterium]|nr:DUF305 domain-containing protein [Rhodothermales bacterium]
MKLLSGSTCVCLLVVAISAFGCKSSNPSGGMRVVQPGAPGEPSRIIDGESLGNDVAAYTEADVNFMQGMIGHHAQALDMTALIEDRTGRRDLRLLGMRISASQKDEIKLMQNWLRKKGEEVPDGTAHHMVHGHAELMPGMLNMEQMQELEQASGNDFYRLFLEYMIMHHEGALTMVDELLASEGAAQDSDIFRFASDVDVDQRMEITRMRTMLKNLR